MDKETNSYQAIATFVKGFFEAYARGVAETNGIDTNEENRSKVKQVMLEHYEEISKHFFDIVLPGLMRLNYNTMEEAQGQMEKDFMEAKAQDAQFTPGINDYLRTACRHGELYEALVTEYKYNFTWLRRATSPPSARTATTIRTERSPVAPTLPWVSTSSRASW